MARYLGGNAFELLDRMKQVLNDKEIRELSKRIQAAKAKQRFFRSNPAQAQESKDLVDWVNQQIKEKYSNTVHRFKFEPEEASRLIYALDENKGPFKMLKGIKPLRIALQPGLMKKIFMLAMAVVGVLSVLSMLSFFSIPIGLSFAAITAISAASFTGSGIASALIYQFLPKIDNELSAHKAKQRLAPVSFGLRDSSTSQINQGLGPQADPDLNPSTRVSGVAQTGAASGSSVSPVAPVPIVSSSPRR